MFSVREPSEYISSAGNKDIVARDCHACAMIK